MTDYASNLDALFKSKGMVVEKGLYSIVDKIGQVQGGWSLTMYESNELRQQIFYLKSGSLSLYSDKHLVCDSLQTLAIKRIKYFLDKYISSSIDQVNFILSIIASRSALLLRNTTKSELS